MDKLEKDKPKHNQIVNHFFVLKGWDYKDKDFYKREGIVYGRHVGSAKKLLILCDQSVSLAKEKLNKVAKWADSRNLNWVIETVLKKWLEVDSLKPREKEPYFRDMKMIKKLNKWYCIGPFGVWLEFAGLESEIIYK